MYIKKRVNIYNYTKNINNKEKKKFVYNNLRNKLENKSENKQSKGRIMSNIFIFVSSIMQITYNLKWFFCNWL